MRVPSGRRSAVLVAALATILVLTATGSAAFAAKAPPGLAQFKYAVGRIESGGDYYARNPRSGAYGTYQILPSNWPSWARQYLGNANARQTPANREKVASGKTTSLYRWLGSWKRVAYWWLTVKTVNLHRGSFDARSTVFKKSWKAAGEHQLTIVVVGTKAHAMVAIDDFVVTK